VLYGWIIQEEVRRVEERPALHWMLDHVIDTDPLDALRGPAREWFARAFPAGPTAVQRLAWPAIAAAENLLLVSPTGTGKTLAAFLAILARLFREHAQGTLTPGPRCVYISPLRSLGYDIERNLTIPLDAISESLNLTDYPIKIGARTGDTSTLERKKLRDSPPHLLITTPESLSLLLSQAPWREAWRTVRHVIVDEVHALVPSKRGADLAASIERLSAFADVEPKRIGLSATCRPAEVVARFLVGPDRACRIIDIGARLKDQSTAAPTRLADLKLDVESLIKPGEAAFRGLTYRRLLRKLASVIADHRTTIVFANTRAFAEKLTHDLRQMAGTGAETIAAHHSALDANRRREVEAALKAGALRAVISSTSLELGVDIGAADLTVLVGLPGSASRCLQRVGRAGHRPGELSRGLMLPASAAEVAGAAVTARAARECRIEPLRPIHAPLDVLSQQLIGMACGGEWTCDEAFALLRRASPFAALERADFDAVLDFLAGELASPAGAYEPDPGAQPRWTSPRIWRHRGRFGARSRRVLRWFWCNVGTITSEEHVRVVVDGLEIGTLEAAYAERLQSGDRFVLDGRALEFRKMHERSAIVRSSSNPSELPRWTSDRQSLSPELALDLAKLRSNAGQRLLDGPAALRNWLAESYELDLNSAQVLVDLFDAQEQISEIPGPDMLLVEESPGREGVSYAFHAPLPRSTCEALSRAFAARIGRRIGLDLSHVVADLGFAIELPAPHQLDEEDLVTLLSPNDFEADVLEGLDRGDLMAQRFRHVASTALMVLRRPDGGRTRVGGFSWVSNRLYPLVKAACPDHPLLRETRREVLEDLLDAPAALRWLKSRPKIRLRSLDCLSPFSAAWIDAGGDEPLRFESPVEALRRLHGRVMASAS
jgi:ATP-dependent helicase Lhr and Lhr-like helicase